MATSLAGKSALITGLQQIMLVLDGCGPDHPLPQGAASMPSAEEDTVMSRGHVRFAQAPRRDSDWASCEHLQAQAPTF